ncbi:MAG: hypothetical protein K0S47_1100 [Herbinix sp.]|jgi:putative nucleotidyltransferase with HDIG domain|nr:hypothetical protein [Herbinix sp.]
MRLRKIEVSRCLDGDIIACDVFHNNGMLILVKDTVINDYIKQQLHKLNIYEISVYDADYHKIKDIEHCDDMSETYQMTIAYCKDIFHGLISGSFINHQLIASVIEKINYNTNEYNNIIQCLLEIRSTDEYTYRHCVNVSFYSMLIAKWLKLSEQEIKKATQAGLLHDIGKTKIPNEILNKKGSLSTEEYNEIKKHTILGYDIIKNIDYFDNDVKKAVLLHHERMDGSGYPFHYQADHLNLYSRIVAVADVFDAMTSNRVYKNKSTPFDVFDIFKTIGYTMFDPKILTVFMNNLATYLVGAKVMLSTGEVGKIAFIPLHQITYPIIELPSGYVDLSKDFHIKIVSMI